LPAFQPAPGRRAQRLCAPAQRAGRPAARPGVSTAPARPATPQPLRFVFAQPCPSRPPSGLHPAVTYRPGAAVLKDPRADWESDG